MSAPSHFSKMMMVLMMTMRKTRAAAAAAATPSSYEINKSRRINSISIRAPRRSPSVLQQQSPPPSAPHYYYYIYVILGDFPMQHLAREKL